MVLFLAGRVSAQTWSSTNIFNNWTAVAMSADGSEIAAAAYPGDFYTSTDSGADWVDAGQLERAVPVLTASADGGHLVAAFYNGHIYTSTNWAQNWVQSSAQPNYWSCLASSADGTHLAAGTGSGVIYTSKDAGATFTSRLSNNNSYQDVAGATDGSVLVAIVYGGGIYRSTDLGNTWMTLAAPSANWTGVASSANGTNLAAVVQGGGIYTSTDSGLTWNPAGVANQNWSAIASSADGSHLAAAVNGGLIYLSTDSGASWTPANVTSNLWSVLYSSADGSRLMALANHSGSAFVSANTGLTWSNAFMIATRFTTNAVFSDSFKQSVTISNVSNHVTSNTTYATNLTFAPVAIANTVIPFTNQIGFSLPSATVTKTKTADLISSLGISIPGDKIFGPKAIHTNLLNTNVLGSGVKLSKVSTTDPAGGLLAVPSFPSTVSTNVTNVLVAQESNVGVVISNVLTVQATVANTSQLEWLALAGSTDGSHLAAATVNGLIYTSADGGNTWSAPDGFIRVSTNAGVAWVRTNVVSSPTQNWSAMASSADGSKLVAAAAGGGILTSSDSGSTWVTNPVPWQIADGEIILSNNAVWESQGMIWTSNNAARQNWSALFCSSDGNSLLALAQFGPPYRSTDGGLTWTNLSTPFDFWKSMASSADGTKLLAASRAGYVYQSTDSGITWNPASVVLGTNAIGIDTLSLGIVATNRPNILVTNFICADTYYLSVTSSNIDSHVLSTNTFQTNIITANTTIDSPVLSFTNLIGFTLPKVTVQTTKVADLASSLGIALPKHKIFGPATVHTVVLGTNDLGTGVDIAKTSINQMAAGTLAVPIVGVTSTNLTNVLVTTVPGISVVISNVLSVQVTVTNKTTATKAIVAVSTRDTNLTRSKSKPPTTTTNYLYSSIGFTNVIAPNAASVGLTNIYGINVTGVTLAGTNTAGIVGLLGINLGGVDELDLGPVSTNLLGTNLLATATMVMDLYETNLVAINLAVPTVIGVVIPGSLVASTNVITLQTNTQADLNILVTNLAQLTIAVTNTPEQWAAVASSADGSHLAAAVNGGLIYTSADGGITWQPSGAPATAWTSLAISSDGSKLLAAAANDVIYSSGDFGATWLAADVPVSSWSAVALSGDGSAQVAVINGGLIYTGTGALPHVVVPLVLLQISESGGNALLAWPNVGSYTVQECAILGAPWEDVPATPTLNGEGFEQVTLPMTNASCYYRLIQPKN